LRFFAAAEVVFFHVDVPLKTDFLRGLHSAGYQAVTFFFVLSGFILAYVYTGSSENIPLNVKPRNFWMARIARILPAYYWALLVSLPVFAYAALVSRVMEMKWFVLGMTLVPTLQQAWWPPAALIWNSPAWSLSVEFVFYALFPVLAYATARLSRSTFVVLAFGLLLAVTAIRLVYFTPAESATSEASNSVAWNFVMFFPPFHLPSFLFGMALGRLFLFGPVLSSRVHEGMLGLGIIALVIVLGERSWFPGWIQSNAALAVLYGLIIFGGARAEGVFRVLTLPFFILLGEISYGMYILHRPLEFWWGWILLKLPGLSLTPLASFAGYFTLVVVASLLTYLYIEKPMRRRILGHREHPVS
jgi:peptidoglycan/LPS O-acetylase OafA/YrhL